MTTLNPNLKIDLAKYPALRGRIDTIITEESGNIAFLGFLNQMQGRLQDAKRTFWDDVYRERGIDENKFDGSYDRKTGFITFTRKQLVSGKAITKRRK